jgi:nicotinamide riboside kinase
MRIYLIGSHSTGKTTLCRYISEFYNLPIITESARAVLAEMETPLEVLRYNIELVNKYQKAVFKRQLKAEKEQGSNFVADRTALDCLAYGAEHSTTMSEMLGIPEFKGYVDWLKKEDALILFIRPHKTLLKEDGVRETPTWESVIRIDGMLKFLLEFYKVNYLPISAPSMQERAKAVNFLLNRCNS